MSQLPVKCQFAHAQNRNSHSYCQLPDYPSAVFLIYEIVICSTFCIFILLNLTSTNARGSMGNKTKKTYGASRRGSKQRGPGRKRKLENNENVDVSPNPPSPTPSPTTQQDPRSLPSSQIVSSSTSSSDTGSTHSKDDQDEFVD